MIKLPLGNEVCWIYHREATIVVFLCSASDQHRMKFTELGDKCKESRGASYVSGARLLSVHRLMSLLCDTLFVGFGTVRCFR